MYVEEIRKEMEKWWQDIILNLKKVYGQIKELILYINNYFKLTKACLYYLHPFNKYFCNALKDDILF